MITNIQKEKIAFEVIRTLYSKFQNFPEDVSNNRNAPFHEAFLNAFSEKLKNKKISSIPVLISLASWLHGLNTSLGQSFLEKTAHILSGGEKKSFTGLKISKDQKDIVNNIITDLSNNKRIPDLAKEDKELLPSNNSNTIDATDFTADVFYEDANTITCIELKTVKPNKGTFKVEKQKILEAKIALRNKYKSKKINYFLGFPFDPQSNTATGYDKQRFMNYSVDFKKYFSEEEFLLSAELWDHLSGSKNTMDTILKIINSIATPDFIKHYKFIKNTKNRKKDKNNYLEILKKWYLFREIELVEKDDLLLEKIENKKLLQRQYYKDLFNDKAEYYENRINKLLDLLNSNSTNKN